MANKAGHLQVGNHQRNLPEQAGRELRFCTAASIVNLSEIREEEIYLIIYLLRNDKCQNDHI